MIVHRVAPFPTGDAGAYALVGMGTLFAGIVRAPMTSVFMIFEITQDYQILVPLMVANMLSFAISRRYQPVPVYHALLHQDGVHLPSAATQAKSMKTARHFMRTDLSFIPPDMTVGEAWQWAAAHDSPAYLVGSRDRLLGTVTHQQLDDWRSTAKAKQPIGAAVDGTFVHAHGDHPIDVLVERLAESGGVLPIVSREDVHKAEGFITSDSIVPMPPRRHIPG